MRKSKKETQPSLRPIVCPMEVDRDENSGQGSMSTTWQESLEAIDFWIEVEEMVVQRLVNDRIDASLECFLDWIGQIGLVLAYYKHERYIRNIESLKDLIKKVRTKRREKVKQELEVWENCHIQ